MSKKNNSAIHCSAIPFLKSEERNSAHNRKLAFHKVKVFTPLQHLPLTRFQLGCCYVLAIRGGTTSRVL
ncbi:unnamed protein product [Lathyrus sativus]|nr:unnamed protein product [Lathyrus sativus]